MTPITGLTATASGLPANVGWWLSIDSMKFSSETNDALYAFLPSGFYQYTFGPSTYAYLASGGSGTLSTAGVSVAITASFSPRYVSLQGTVTPATANAAILLNGTAISVADGSFNAVMVAGTYSLSVSAPGYDDNNTTVTLTPGNLTTVDVLLNAQSGSGGSSTSALGGLSTVDALIIIAGVIAVVALVSAALVMSSGRRRHPPRRRAPPPPETE